MMLRGDFDLTEKDGLKSLIEAAMKVLKTWLFSITDYYHLYDRDTYYYNLGG